MQKSIDIAVDKRIGLTIPYKKKKRIFNKKVISLYVLMLPAVLLLLIFNYIPMYGVVIAFKDYLPFLGPIKSPWVGFKHFEYFFKDAKFWSVMGNTLLINTYDIVFGFTAPILFALLANEIINKSYKKVMQTVSYLPNFLSWVVVAGMAYEILSPSKNGLVNILLGNFFGIEPIFFMTDARKFRSIAVIIEIWKSVGWGSILYLATITGIDPSLYEAAYVDGANRIKQLIHVTIPGVLPMIVLMFLLRISTIFSIGFERIFLLQNPVIYSVSDVISTYVYRLGLEQSQFSLTTAIGLTQSILGFIMLTSANKISAKISGLGLY